MKKGLLYALGAYSIWGLFPLYWKFVKDVPALQIIGHRIAWSFVLLALVVLAAGQGRQIRSSLTRPCWPFIWPPACS